MWKIALFQLSHFCVRRKLNFSQTVAACNTSAYSDRLASSFRLATATLGHLRSSSKQRNT